MNPPPFPPPEENKNTLVRQIFLASLLALPVVAVIILATFYAIHAQKKAAEERAMVRHMTSSASEMQANLKKNFDPKKGITNVDFTELSKFRDGLNEASQKFSGDDAVCAKVMANYLDRVQAAATNYQAAVVKLRDARVLDNFDSSDKSQIAARRRIVLDFMEANANLKQVFVTSEDRVRADLTAAKIRESSIDSYMKGFHASVAPRNTLVVKIRECDDHMGIAMLDVFNTLETQWGHWKANPSDGKIHIEDTASLHAYNQDVTAIQTAGQEQLKLQKMLVNLPATPQQ